MKMGMLSCLEATRLMSQGLDRKLSFGERVSLRVHLSICNGCRNFDKQVSFLRRAVRAAGRSQDTGRS